MKPLLLAGISLILVAGCSDSSDNFAPEPVPPDFTEADAWMEGFVATEESFPGGSYIVVDRELGVIHKAAFGNQTEDSLVLLASTSKVPTVTLLMALHEDDDNVEFDISAPIANYLPWQGVWDAAITTEHLVSNRSGIPGLVNVFIDQASYDPHGCQFLPTGSLYDCAQTIYTSPLPGLTSTPPGTAFDYGGSQWQLSGGVAEVVGGGAWNQLWDQYIAGPCDMEIATYGNNLSFSEDWDGQPESLVGRDNPNQEGGMMSNLDDYARLLSLHLNEGLCGDNRVLSAEGVAFMRLARTEDPADGSGYGMGWWLEPREGDGPVTLFTDGGYYGSLARHVEEYGAITCAAGGSSGSITTFLLESMWVNPDLHNCRPGKKCGDLDRDARMSLMLKSVIGLTETGLFEDVATINELLDGISSENILELLNGPIPEMGLEAMALT